MLTKLPVFMIFKTGSSTALMSGDDLGLRLPGDEGGGLGREPGPGGEVHVPRPAGHHLALGGGTPPVPLDNKSLPE